MSFFLHVSHHSFYEDLLVCINASGEGIGGVLMQEGRWVSYESIKWNVHEHKYPTHDLELLAIVHALKA